jgi:hypothetical protein
MSKNIENNLSEYEKYIINEVYGICYDCFQPKTDFNWCKNCNSKRFQQDFNKWTSGNELIDKFIQDTQLKARNSKEFIEWIPYNKLRNIQYLAQGGFSVVYKAILLDGFINEWNDKTYQWERFFYELKDEYYEDSKQENIKSPLNKNEKNGWHVVLKSLKNSSRINKVILNEVNNLYNK